MSLRHISGRTVVFLIAVAAVLAIQAPSHSGDPQSGSDYAYAGAGRQFASWDVSTTKIGLTANPSTSMSNDRCMDSMVDWYNGGDHYDARIVRSCDPEGPAVSTDPGGNGFWQERPVDWDNANVTRLQKGWGYVFDDDYDYVNRTFEITGREPFDGAGSGSISGVPRCTDDFARVRIRYDDGHFDTCDNYPATEG